MSLTTEPKTTPIAITKTYEFTAWLNDELVWLQENGDCEPIPGVYVASLKLWSNPGDMLTIKIEVCIDGEWIHPDAENGYGFLNVTTTMQNVTAYINGRSLDWGLPYQKTAWECLGDLWIDKDAKEAAMGEVY